jgi:hypothetical protein
VLVFTQSSGADMYLLVNSYTGVCYTAGDSTAGYAGETDALIMSNVYGGTSNFQFDCAANPPYATNTTGTTGDRGSWLHSLGINQVTLHWVKGRFPLFVQGCSSQGVSGASFSIYDVAGGTLLASGTTDATGHAYPTLPIRSTCYFVVSASRFYGYSGTEPFQCGTISNLQIINGSFDTTIYACESACGYPIKQTLYLSMPGLGSAVPLIYQVGLTPSQWTSANIVIGANTYQFQFLATGGLTIYKNAGTGGAVTCNGSNYHITCPPSFSFTFDMTIAACSSDLGTTGTITE